MKKEVLFLLAVVLISSLLFVNNIFAQEEEETSNSISEEIDEVLADEDITAEDLGVSDPTLLPDSPFYFLKDAWRNIRTSLTFNSVKKAEVRLQYANQRLIEIKKLAQKNNKEDTIQKAVEKYQTEMERIRNRTEKFRENAQDNPDIDGFLNRFTDRTMKQQQLMDRLEKNLSDKPEVMEKIQAAKEKSLENFGEVIGRLEENKEQIRERIENNLEGIEGSQYKKFKNLEVLIRLEEKVPEQAKEAIQQAQENALKRLNNNLEQMSPENQEKFSDYLDNISGDQTTHLQILQRLKETQPSQTLRQIIEQNRERAEERVQNLNQDMINVQERIRERVQERVEEQTEAGESVQQGSPTGQAVACPMIWSPVCGKDGKTYGNPCLAKTAGVEIASQGKCNMNIESGGQNTGGSTNTQGSGPGSGK